MSRLPASDAGGIVTGARYVEQITALASDRRARTAFRDLVLRVAAPGAALFDFGSGTGMDARFYAECGFKVAAYDVDPHMCAFFAEHCRDLIEAGRVSLDSGDYRNFLAHGKPGGLAAVDLVTANFAPLNLIDDLHELFAKFHALSRPDGRVLASVLSPWFVGDLQYGWWWRNSLRLLRVGHFSVPGVQGPIVRRRLADFARHSAPYFTLERVFRGLPAPPRRDVAGVGLNGGAFGRALGLSTCRFMFLLFHRRPLGGADGERRCG
ncbi:MAG TPA: methyltransferase domain-containing protein [Steroidobacteraceae bacterium]